MINFLLLHGWYGDSQENWFPWMKSQLENEGHTVFAPDLPDPIHPTPEAWQAVLDEFKEDMKDGIVIGHSLGAPTAIRCITQNNLPIRHLIFVAPTFPKQRRVIDLSQYEGLIETQERFYAEPEDLEKISHLCEKISLFLSKDDPYIPYDHAWTYYSQIAGIELHSFEDKGHFNENAGVTEFPELLGLVMEK